MTLWPFSPLLWNTQAGTFRSSLTWEATFPVAVVVVIALAFLALLVRQWLDLGPRTSRRARLGLTALRFGAYAVVLGMLLNPALLIQKVMMILPQLAVLVDTSGSMGLSTDGEPTRLQGVVDYLHDEQRSALDKLAERYEIALYQFDDTVRMLPREDLPQVQSGGQRTDLIGAVTHVLDDNRSAPPVGVMVLSDGVHHGSDTGLGYLRRAGVPVVAVGVGNLDTYRDIRVVDVQAPSLTFLHYPADVTATIQVWGFAEETLAVVLQRDGRVVATQRMLVASDASEQQMTFPLEPDVIGEFAYTVSIAPRLGEALTDNNRVDFPLSVVRDKIRVLLVCGSPTWNYRFLRQALKLDPSIDLLSFVILRTANDVVNVPESQLSLIPFPTERLFTRELRNFDLIIFENFDSRRYFPVTYLQNVARYVVDGGAFAMIGGPLAFSQGGYLGTPIEAILPVSLRRERRDYEQVAHQLMLTEEGRTHPITRLSSDDRENERIWESMPELDALNRVGQAKPGATVLAVTGEPSETGPGAPLLAMQSVGEGRTLALMSDYTWKWNFQLAGRMDSNQYYLQFVRQMVRWLIHDPVLKQVRSMADAREFPVGSEVTGLFQVLQDDYRPATEAVLRPTLRTPRGQEMAVPYRPTGNPGEYRYRFRAEEEGLYELDVQAQIMDKTHEANRLLLPVRRPGNENHHGAPNHDLLRDIADRTDGTFFTLDDRARPTLASLAQFFGGEPDYRVLEESRLRLRESLPLFLVLLTVLAVEWWWRRRVGLL